MELDLDRVRKSFPALAQGIAYFDGPGGSQVPRQVAHAVASTMGSGISNRGTTTVSERRAEQVVSGARQAVADLLGVPCRIPARPETYLERLYGPGWISPDPNFTHRWDRSAYADLAGRPGPTATPAAPSAPVAD